MFQQWDEKENSESYLTFPPHHNIIMTLGKKANKIKSNLNALKFEKLNRVYILSDYAACQLEQEGILCSAVEIFLITEMYFG